MNSIQKQLTDMVFDINPAEISSHIENDSLRQWCQTWGSKMLEIISSIPFVKDDNYEKGYQDGLNADKWISVDDRLPEESYAVLVYCPERKNIYCAYLEEDQWWIFGAYSALMETVTKWKSLPSMPKEENL